MSHPLLTISCVNNNVLKTKTFMTATNTKCMNSRLTLFTQSDILQQIGIGSLQKFLNQFTDSDPQFTSLVPESPYYLCELSRLFALSLSPHLVKTLLLLETAASPENYDRLTVVAQQRLPNLCVTEF